MGVFPSCVQEHLGTYPLRILHLGMCAACGRPTLEHRLEVTHGVVIAVPSHGASEERVVEQHLTMRGRVELADLR